jgi:4-amino-4-deoxy-L-arabinose transferase-like glycosyltransferase
VAALAGARLRREPVRVRARWTGGVASLRSTLTDPAVATAALLVLGTLAWRTLLALRLPVVDYDGWSYHLVFVDAWLQHDALVLVPQRPWTAGYPAATELLTTWLAAFTRTDALTGFTALIPIPLAIAATTGLARSFGADRRRALLAGLLFGMIPALVALAGTTYVDAASVAAVLTTWWLGLRVVRGERDRSAVLLLGIAAGLALGTKGTNVLLLAPVLAVAGLLLLRDVAVRRAGERGVGPALGRLALLLLPVLLLGASWYLKNLVVHGNPLYPFAMGPFAGPTTLAEFAFVPPELEGSSWIGQLARSWLADWDLARYPYNVRPGGLGRAWPVILALAIGGGLLLVRRRQALALSLVVLPAVVTLAVMPMPWYARLTLFVPGVALPLAAVALGALRPRLALAGGLGLVGLAAVSLAFANIRPNIDLRPASPGVASAREYLGLVLDSDAARRSNVSLRAECAGFDVIPAGARVAPGGFNLLHGVVGPAFDRILTEPLGPVSDPASLAAAMRAQDASWLVTSAGGGIDAMAQAAPDLFLGHGEVCQGGRLWQLRAGG